MDYSGVKNQGIVNESVVGSNTTIEKGEATASLIGPFVGFHHQSLLIAAFWPEGKGNIGYGANIGSNHTSRAPDQEIWPGEGMFFGLSSAIKYPANFQNAPYSIISTGVTTLPQKMEFPFSLILHSVQSKPGYNQIIPGWVLSDNIYAILRNENKYKKRNKSKHSIFETEIFRKEIVDMLVKGKDRLESVSEVLDDYYEKDIPGLGKNFLLEKDRIKGIEIYHFYIQYFILKEIVYEVIKEKIDKQILLSNVEFPPYLQKLIIKQKLGNLRIQEGIQEFENIYQRIIKSAIMSREKDLTRGKQIINDYLYTHSSIEDDEFLNKLKENLEKIKEKI
jgi:hypothetical protein